MPESLSNSAPWPTPRQPRNSFDVVSEEIAALAIADIDRLFDKAHRLPLLDYAKAIVVGVLQNAIRQSYSKAAAMVAAGVDISSAILPADQPKKEEPPSPI